MENIFDLDILYKFLNNKLNFKERSEFIENISSISTDSLLKEVVKNAENIKNKNPKNLANYYFHIFLFFSKVFETEKLKELLIEILKTEKNLLSILGSYIGSCLSKGCKELKYSINFDWERVNIFKRLNEIVSYSYELSSVNNIVRLIFTIYQLDRKIAINILKKDKHHIVFFLFIYYYCDTFKLLEYKNFAKEFLKSEDYIKKYALFFPILEIIEKLSKDKSRYCKENLDDFIKKEKEILKIDCKKLEKELRVFTKILYLLFRYIKDKLERAEIFLSAFMFTKPIGFKVFDNIINCEEIEKVLSKTWNKSLIDFYKILVILDKEIKCTNNENIKFHLRNYLLTILNDNLYENDINLWKEIIRYLTKWNLKDFFINLLEGKKMYIEKTLIVDKYLHYNDYLNDEKKYKTYKKILDLIK